jgi:hypothetical protein
MFRHMRIHTANEEELAGVVPVEIAQALDAESRDVPQVDVVADSLAPAHGVQVENTVPRMLAL